MSVTIENLLETFDKVQNPVTKGTLKIAFGYLCESLGKENDLEPVSSFLNHLGFFYRTESGKGSSGYENRGKFDSVNSDDKINNAYTKAALKAMENSVIDSMNDPWENRRAVYSSLNELREFYWNSLKESGSIETKKYRDLDYWSKLELFNEYRRCKEGGMTRSEFVRANRLSSTYALDKIRKDYEAEDDIGLGKSDFEEIRKRFVVTEREDYAPLSSMLNEVSLVHVAMYQDS